MDVWIAPGTQIFIVIFFIAAIQDLYDHLITENTIRIAIAFTALILVFKENVTTLTAALFVPPIILLAIKKFKKNFIPPLWVGDAVAIFAAVLAMYYFNDPKTSYPLWTAAAANFIAVRTLQPESSVNFIGTGDFILLGSFATIGPLTLAAIAAGKSIGVMVSKKVVFYTDYDVRIFLATPLLFQVFVPYIIIYLAMTHC